MRHTIWIFLTVSVWVASSAGWAQQPGAPGSVPSMPPGPSYRAPTLPPIVAQPAIPGAALRLPSSTLPGNSMFPNVPVTSPYAPLGPPVSLSPQTATYVNPFAQAQRHITTPQAAMAGGVPRASNSVPMKPYANFTPPPALSPYMNLFRNDNDFGIINNYYSLVKPALDQRATNQQTQNQIQSLQTTTRAQSQELNQLNPQIKKSPSVPPGSFMNMQNYYPGFQTPGR